MRTHSAVAVATMMAALAVLAGARSGPLPGGPRCQTAADCNRNGDCVDGACRCDPAWTGSAVCDTMAFAKPSNEQEIRGYFNATASSWGGFPILHNGTYHLFHAQMRDGCGLGSWKTNSIVARSSTAKAVNGPYVFQEEVFAPFAHNPTIRYSPTDGKYVVFFIGGWATTPTRCGEPGQPLARGLLASRDATGPAGPGHAATPCSGGATLDPHSRIRVGGDYRDVVLPTNATVQDCVAACCGDARCLAFSFNTPSAPGKDAPGCKTEGKSCCKLKATQPSTQPSGCPTCQTGLVPRTPAPPAKCTALHWDKTTCGPNMPGPMNDTCGAAPLNAGCGIRIGSSDSVHGPWTTQPLVIRDQWRSERLYCAHTNPSPVFLANGTVVLAFNAGYCDGGLETIGVAVAPHWSGPYTLLTPDAILANTDGSIHHGEDPFLWHTTRGWHLLIHNQQGPQGEAAYAHSGDGRSWTLSPTTPYSCTVTFADGKQETISGCGNRPQVFLNATSGRPAWLINGGMRPRGPNGGPDSFTLFRPLIQARAL